jgi:hypothetical protein
MSSSTAVLRFQWRTSIGVHRREMMDSGENLDDMIA